MKTNDKNKARKRKMPDIIFVFAVVIIVGILVFASRPITRPYPTEPIMDEPYLPMYVPEDTAPDVPEPPPTIPESEPESEPEPEPEPEPMPWELFHPHSLPETHLDNFPNFAFASQINGPLYPMHFGMPDSYSPIGITTFRGNNFRNSASWGTARVVEERLTVRYQFAVGRTERWTSATCAEVNCTVENCTEGHQRAVRWTGVGWTGQPAIVQWDTDVQQIMNLHPEMRGRDNLIEVIYGAMDGFIYFFDLETGEPTRDRISIGRHPIKGGVTVDPRGYPILYVGQGDLMYGNRFGYYIFSLIDGSELFFIDGHDPFAWRRWGAFDSNPLFDTVNDRMILAGENGVIYSILLNTEFDRSAETISIDPVISRYRHTGSRVLGTENSPAAFGHYLFFADNSGIIQCLDLRTLEPVWVFNAGDDTDATIVLEWSEETQQLYLYTATQVDLQGPGGRAFIRKLNASNGQVIWEYSYPCLHNPRVNGGVTATPVLGQHDISDLVIFWVAMITGRGGGGALTAFDRQTGEIVWENIMPHFGWSSPVAVYTDDGTSYIIVSDSTGNMFLLRGTTGEILYRINLGANVEASPAVWGNMIVVGTRGERIFGIEIS
ncbi:MAG: PQQ-binding-like beta-propeller repeat protein [Oscillospiraceae bacterium]|nr:PQQ-binding-like beta-propeller repeat protein [Oscillospiraceae bacterium]